MAASSVRTEPHASPQDSASFAGKRVHFIGVAGCGMRALAQVLVRHGAAVSGSDACSTGYLQILEREGVTCWSGHDPSRIDGPIDRAVVSAAIPPDDPELVKLRSMGVPLLKYAQMLGLLMERYEGIAIAGTHGKSTTTAMTAYTFRRAGLDPSFVVGANVDQLAGASGAGTGDYFIAEACEYDRSFLNLRPRFAGILNIEEDHLDYYRSLDEILDAFETFVSQVRPGGLAIINGQDPNIRRFADRVQARTETFGLSPTCHWQAEDIRLENGSYEFDITYRREAFGHCRLELPGKHNVLNALAAAALAHHAGIKPEIVCQAIGEFRGANRRLTLKACAGGITLLDDYAHHPTEIRASLRAAKERYEPKRLWCVFQPHQHSRTRFLLDDFAHSFADADVVMVPDIYFVRDSETERQLINSGDLVARIARLGGTACYLPRFDQIADYLQAKLAPGDLVITMGAGDIWKICDELIHWLGRDSN